MDCDADSIEKANDNIRKAGVSDRIELVHGDSLGFLKQFRQKQDRIDFAFLDGNHSAEHLFAEFEMIHPQILAAKGKVYFDNTQLKGIREALNQIQKRYGGNFIQFDHCSWKPPGNVIWQDKPI